MPTPKYQPNCTLYLCAGTGLDYNNSIWMHKFAYPYTTDPYDTSWWNALFQFIKAHSIAEGYWYLTDTRPHSGVIRVGRAPLLNGIITGETGLGSAAKQAELDNPEIPYEDAIRAVDYLVFTNRRGNEGSGEEWYAFVDEIRYINQNVAEIRYTVDAILSFQKFFYLGRGMVSRDMQFEERVGSETGTIYQPNQNYQPEPIEPDDSMYVFQHCSGDTPAMQAFDLGAYNAKFVCSDVALGANDITSNQWITGLPAFKPAFDTVVPVYDVYKDPIVITDARSTRIGIGTYFVSPDKSPEDIKPFVDLGAFNAFEHILYTYSVPEKIVKYGQLKSLANAGGGTGLVPIMNTGDYDADEYKCTDYNLAFPVYYDDTTELILHESSYATPSLSYTPINLKTHQAPYNYFSITDKQGNSIEIVPQSLNPIAVDDTIIYNFPVTLVATLAPNILSSLFIKNYDRIFGSKIQPLQTLWQIPAYVMTPNNSGYMLDSIAASQNIFQGVATVAIGAATTLAAGAAMGGMAGIGAMSIGALTGAGMSTYAAGSQVGRLSAAGNIMSTAGSTMQSYGTNAILKAGQNLLSARAGKTYGLPKAQGGLPTGKTLNALGHAGYEVYRVHLKENLLRLVDTFFTRFGYAQNVYRYPHINIRRRWCFVQVENIDLIPLQANNYNRGGIPTEFRQQIIDRLKAGVTFWNVRRAIKGDDSDADPIGDTNWSQMSDIINCKFIKNYGSEPDSDEAKDNMSYTGGYCDYYTDDFQPVISP